MSFKTVSFLSVKYTSYQAVGVRDYRVKSLAFENTAKQFGKHQLHLHVNRYNVRAVAVYQHYGFEIAKTVDTPLG